ncbi:MAG: LPXTG cell wall anchor domain-containing protein [Clostridia bacterium]|nr:LPXTG cell wall anchor domain-containing protein [Clostridia bacterium]
MKKLFMIIVAVIVCMMPFGVLAGAASPSGKITVVMINRADKSPLQDKTVNVVKVADCLYSDRTASFTLTGDFSDSHIDITDTGAAMHLYDTAVGKGLKGTAIKSDAEGKASLPCELGAYLVYSPDKLFNPFVVFVPYETAEELIFDVTAEPKIDISVTEPTDPDSPTSPLTPTNPTTPSENTTKSSDSVTPVIPPVVPVVPPVVPYVPGEHPTRTHTTAPDGTPGTDNNSSSDNSGEKLPQTGMVQYPIPILGFAGVMMFAIGFIIYGEGKKKEN